jgi:hypothetical protein
MILLKLDNTIPACRPLQRGIPASISCFATCPRQGLRTAAQSDRGSHWSFAGPCGCCFTKSLHLAA